MEERGSGEEETGRRSRRWGRVGLSERAEEREIERERDRKRERGRERERERERGRERRLSITEVNLPDGCQRHQQCLTPSMWLSVIELQGS